MTYPNRKTLVTALALAGLFIIIFGVTQGFRRSGDGGGDSGSHPGNTYSIKAFKLPDVVTFAGEKMPLENFDTRESLEREILISAYRHSSTILIIKRANRYFPQIEKILREYNIPDDFKYLVAAESEYTNMVSPAGATGFWQIMPETGKEQGMEINQVVDERYHVEKSTRFACEYFLKSHEKYGSWTLAAASYNGGRSRMDEQLEMQRQNNYYDLLLAEETARYIFRVVAYKLIITDPVSFGFDIGKEDLYPELKYYEVKIDSAITDISAFAGKFGTNYKMLKLLNPWLRKPFLTPKPNKEYVIKIPVEGMRSIERTEAENGSNDKEDLK
ncbi:MAG: lytic transglycosylase domain-containing protein [Bacteroidales bacterium]|nr:lytic transglycosylase domain-containing protein [Bacteroidales bacterium]MBK8882862.1 lytic transglycosylase domain-containing protein [Bacteroidales bacterium]